MFGASMVVLLINYINSTVDWAIQPSQRRLTADHDRLDLMLAVAHYTQRTDAAEAGSEQIWRINSCFAR